MGKKKHGNIKIYQKYKELLTEYKAKHNSSDSQMAKLPFDYCSLSFLPFENPVCTKEGDIFDIMNILPYIKQYNKNPISGKPLKVSDLIKMKFYKNEKNNYFCPITCKTFTNNIQLICIKETGNVYSYEAYKDLNEKENFYYDLIDNSAFKKENVIMLNTSRQVNEIEKYDFIVKNEKLNEGEEENEDKVNINEDQKRMLVEMERDNKEEEIYSKEIISRINNNISKGNSDLIVNKFTEGIIKSQEKEFMNIKMSISNIIERFILHNKNILLYINKYQKEISNESFNQRVYLFTENIFEIIPKNSLFENLKISSFTYFYLNLDKFYLNNTINRNNNNLDSNINHEFIYSTSSVSSKQMLNISLFKRRDIFYSQLKSENPKQSKVEIVTNYGSFVISLYYNQAPKTCENFLELCHSGYYNQIRFSKIIKSHIIQVNSTQNSDDMSIFGGRFELEIGKGQKHSKRGIVSIINSSINKNMSQFFITFREERELDNNHIVIGEVIENISVLDKFEVSEVDNYNQPVNDIFIINTNVIYNPFREIVKKNILIHLIYNSLVYISKSSTSLLIENQSNQLKSDLFSDSVGVYINKKRNIDK